ncbi:hypothetical protein AX17_001573 [Amanita inopinata Kibby_2008]|nr:hypothetical protein AX17_001573 [Amanita inopinata Kibby_2008]
MKESDSVIDARWIPLESNPDVFNAWAEKAGLVTSQACFHEMFGLEDQALDMVPQPVKAIILLFPLDPKTEAQHKADDELIAKEGQPSVDKTIMWIQQTIDNACGTMALLHALANTDVTIRPESPLAKFIDICKDKTPLERAKTLETTPLFANIHAELAAEGQTPVPTNLNTDLHFTCFVAAPSEASREEETIVVGLTGGDEGEKVDGALVGKEAGRADKETAMRLIELDGERAGPIDRGECHDLLRDVVRIVKSVYMTRIDSVYFSLMALSPPFDD